MTDTTDTQTQADDISRHFSDDEAHFVNILNTIVEEMASQGQVIPMERIGIMPLVAQVDGEEARHDGMMMTYLTGVNQELQLFYRSVSVDAMEEDPRGNVEDWLTFYNQYPDQEGVTLINKVVQVLQEEGFVTYDVQWFDKEGIEAREKLYFPLVIMGHGDGRTLVIKTDPVDLDLVDSVTQENH